MKIPLVDLKAQYQSIKPEIDQAIQTVIQETSFIGGPHLEAFESSWAQFCKTKYAIGVSNGTDAIRLALLACGVRAGDEVMTVANTFIATAEGIHMAGARAKFVDVDPKTFNMDPKKLKASLTPKTKAILPVHLYGRPAEMDPILSFAKEHDLKVVGDAAQAHGAYYKGKPIGALGDAVSFSFFPGKNLGAYGDAGGVVTNDPVIAEKVALLRDHGRKSKYEHKISGFNCRMDSLQAAILSVKLKHLEAWTQRRIEIGKILNRSFQRNSAIQLIPEDEEGTRSVFHLYVIHIAKRDAVQKLLQEKGIATGVHYPIPLHLQPAHADYGGKKGDFPVSEDNSQRALSLPIYAELTNEQVNYIAETVKAAVAST